MQLGLAVLDDAHAGRQQLRVEGTRDRILHAEFAHADQQADVDPAPRRLRQRLAELAPGAKYGVAISTRLRARPIACR
jgi:hypothetical protein